MFIALPFRFEPCSSRNPRNLYNWILFSREIRGFPCLDHTRTTARTYSLHHNRGLCAFQAPVFVIVGRWLRFITETMSFTIIGPILPLASSFLLLLFPSFFFFLDNIFQGQPGNDSVNLLYSRYISFFFFDEHILGKLWIQGCCWFSCIF